MLPKDPIILLSYLNTKLRDEYDNIDELCNSLDVNCEELLDIMRNAGFSYDGQLNQFR